MDFGALIGFAFSIWVAIQIAEGNTIKGIIIYLIIHPLFIFIGKKIRKFFKKFLAKLFPPKRKETKGTHRIAFNEEHFHYRLDEIIRFLKSYSEVLPNKWYYLYITIKYECQEYGYTVGYLEFTIVLGEWWDSLLWEYPKISKWLKENFTNESSRKFTACYPIANSTTAKAFPTKEIMKMLNKYLNTYEKKHREIRFKREKSAIKLDKIR